MKTCRGREKPAPFSQHQPNTSAGSAALRLLSCSCGTDTSLSLLCLQAHPQLLKTLSFLAKRPLWPVCNKTVNVTTWGTRRESTFSSSEGRQSGRNGVRLTQCFPSAPKSHSKSTAERLQAGHPACPHCH